MGTLNNTQFELQCVCKYFTCFPPLPVRVGADDHDYSAHLKFYIKSTKIAIQANLCEHD